jgi:hypothetical protein
MFSSLEESLPLSHGQATTKRWSVSFFPTVTVLEKKWDNLRLMHYLNETKPKKTKDSNYWFCLVNSPWNPLRPPTHEGPQSLGPPNPWGPPTHGGPQPMGAANPWSPYPWGLPSFVGTSPLGPLSRRTLGTPNFGAPILGGPRALGAPRPGLVGNPPLPAGRLDILLDMGGREFSFERR